MAARNLLREALFDWFDQAGQLAAELPDRQRWTELLADDPTDDGEYENWLDVSPLEAVREPIRLDRSSRSARRLKASLNG